ncbi:MAG: sugar ABC transporter permease [Oscillospiraceae bacterium]
MKKSKPMIIAFLTPALLSFLIMYLYPVVRTVIMSFFKVENITTPLSEWSFAGIRNFINLWQSSTFRTSIVNMLKIWFIGGLIVLAISMLMAVILTSGVRCKGFFRAAIYLPNVISAIALATMWTQFVFSQKYGLIKSVFEFFGMENAANINWMSTDMKFTSMMIAFCFGSVGYYMLIFLSGIERIPPELYEAATIDGASKVNAVFSITFPLLKGVFKTNLTLWSVNTIGFFVWSKMFSPLLSETSTITPLVYMFDTVFGTKGTTASRDAGAGAALGVTLTLFVLLTFFVLNRLIKDNDLEF